MESLESRLERLTPEQQREVEDFVDFLLLKNNFRQAQVTAISPSPSMMNAPPVLSADPPVLPQSLVRMQDLILQEEVHPPVTSADPPPIPIHEIGARNDDWITHDYMDYGKFDQQPSPATDAVKNVRRKIIAHEAEEKPRKLLDWVD
ncbi:MAG: hypothetical protein PHT99_01400 [Methanoregula sp.]|nr:hypothetical protein [Methanoregula sp.]